MTNIDYDTVSPIYNMNIYEYTNINTTLYILLYQYIIIFIHEFINIIIYTVEKIIPGRTY